MSLPIKKIVTRDSFGQWLEANKLTGMGVEVGTYYGAFAEMLATQWEHGQVFTVDPYNWNVTPAYVDGCRTDWAAADKRELDPEVVMGAAKVRLASLRNCRMLRMTSLEAAAQFTDESLAFVYLDGDHSEAAVAADFAAWLPKVRPGGIIAGHDFYDRDDHLMRGGVFSFLWDYCMANNWKPHVTQCTSWWFVKP
jgi:predicted O-methyltransferase YrrM